MGRLRAPLLVASAALLQLAVAACARQGAPPGGDPDRVPPVVTATRPDTFAALEAVEGAIRIAFSERISERPTSGSLDDAVLVSPRTGEVSVSHERDAIEVDLSGGVRPGFVYRVTVLPVIQDMFNNPLQEPFEFVFSTGPDFVSTAVAGLVLDRITGEVVAEAQVIAREVGGDTSVVYTARTDTSGIYALRYLPPAEYEVVAFSDRDRNFRPGASEVQGRTVVTVRDTVLTDLVILEPDTVPARLATATPVDSTAIRLEFDDHLDPELDPATVTVTLAPDSAAPDTAPPPPAVTRVFHPWGWEERVDSIAAARDTTGAAEEADTADAEPEGLLPGPLPERQLVALLDGPLPAGVPYAVTVEGVRNVAGLEEGGGTRTVLREVPEEPAMPTPDTTGAPGDTTGASPDTTRAPRLDTTAAPPDTTGAPPDTTGAPPDTTTRPPGGSGAALRPPGPDGVLRPDPSEGPYQPVRRRGFDAPGPSG